MDADTLRVFLLTFPW